ncbi:prokineticin-2 isoform X2 [Loxodonta africana]|uniref:prokineticin-2 isoform X2 n=1 Tax=Loxodonta africana TaxID=9785 RepID=UPI000C811F77|nr:prokineticin-2 isoform X1 [Loxodonta africana]XP_023403785.1 prokineticin-2 isoform X1 [Loxodonta africana]
MLGRIWLCTCVVKNSGFCSTQLCPGPKRQRPSWGERRATFLVAQAMRQPGTGNIRHHVADECVVLFLFQACDKDPQCGGGMCCAVSIWVKSIRICTPMGKVGDICHPLTRKVPFFGRRMHHTCPCLPGLSCLRTSFSRFICLPRK